jgi:hypothetical protein
MKAMNLTGFALGVSLLAALPGAARADVVTFNFESLAIASGLTTLTLSGGGLTATLTRPGSIFGITNLFFDGGDPSFGQRSLDPATDLPSNTPFILNFSQAITGLSIDMGDFGVDTDLLSIQLWSGANGTGTLLGSSSATLPPGGAFSFLTPAVGATAALSAVFIGGSAPDFPNSVYYDNIRVTFGTTTTPEPGTLALFASGFIALGLLRRRKNT